MIRPAVMLATIPAAVFAVFGQSKSPPIKPHEVATESVRVVRMDDQTFRQRWQPLYAMPPAVEVRYAAPVARETAVADTVARLDSPQPRPRHRLHSELAGMPTCIRHRMRTVYTRGGKSWRCRR